MCTSPAWIFSAKEVDEALEAINRASGRKGKAKFPATTGYNAGSLYFAEQVLAKARGDLDEIEFVTRYVVETHLPSTSGGATGFTPRLLATKWDEYRPNAHAAASETPTGNDAVLARIGAEASP